MIFTGPDQMSFRCYLCFFATTSKLVILTTKIIKVVCWFFFCYFCVQSLVVNMNLYHSLPNVKRQKIAVDTIEINAVKMNSVYWL